MGQVFKIDKKGVKKGILGIKDHISDGRKNVRESKRKKKKRNSSFSLRYMEISWLEFVGPRTKVHLLAKGYTWVLKTWDFTEDSS